MATIVIVTRKTRKGNRYQVRYRLGGRAYPLLHAGVLLTPTTPRSASSARPAARRWAPIRPDLLMLILDETPPDAAPPLRGSSQGCRRTRSARRCGGPARRAGIASYSPHDLRHRWVSVQLRRGVPVIDVQAAAGHTDASMTLGVYGHVLVDTDDI